MSISSVRQWFATQQWLLWATSGMMISLGLSVLYSLFYNTPEIKIFYRQLIYVSLGLILAFLVEKYDYRTTKKIIPWMFIFSFSLLILVLLVGSTINGTTGWLNLKFFSFQPVEIAKLTAIFSLASFFARYHNLLYSWRVLIVSFLIPLPFAILIMLQPDLGSTLALYGIWLGFLLASSLSWRSKFLILFTGLLLVIFSWFFLLKDYQRARLGTFLNPEVDSQNFGYNTLQSITAVGSGRLLGKGLGYGSQSQLHFLPEAHSDFIFAVLAEESGWIGSVIFLAVTGFFLFSILNTAQVSRDNFGYFLSIGIFWFFLIHFSINVGMNLGILPVIGLPLPFLSAGGTNLFVSFLMIGVLQSITGLGVKKI